MATATETTHACPMNIVAARGTRAAHRARSRGGLPGTTAVVPEAIAPGLPATPAHDLVFHGGKTIPSLTFTNFYIAGDSAWAQGDMKNIDHALAAAMSDPHL